MAASPKLVDYSSTDSESSSEGPSTDCPSTKKRIHRMPAEGKTNRQHVVPITTRRSNIAPKWYDNFLARSKLASFPGRFCGGEEKRPGHHCWRMRVVPIKTWEFVHVCTLSAYTLVISRNISVHDYECLSVLLQLRER